jgi:hypothetical protein
MESNFKTLMINIMTSLKRARDFPCQQCSKEKTTHTIRSRD